MAILVMSTNGTYTTKTTLEVARTALDVVGKTVVVTTALTEAQSNILAAWPADRALKVEKGGSIVFSSPVTFLGKVVMSSGSKITTDNSLVFGGGFDAPPNYLLDASGFVQFLNIDKIYPQWFGAMGDAVFATGSITTGSTALTVSSPGGLAGGVNAIQNGDTLFINGAGNGGAVLATSVVSGGGTANIVISTPALTTVTSRAIATRNDTTALQRFFASTKAAANTVKYGTSQPSATGCTKLYVPKGMYTSFDTINMYSGSILDGEFANTVGGSRIVQCNREKPLINVVADNFDVAGNSINGGNGNNIFRNIIFSGSEITDNVTNANMINFQYAWNVHADTEFDHVLWQNTAGACVGGGFQTMGAITSGTTTLTLVDGSVFRSGNVNGGKITIVGAGVAGANLDAYIISGGGTNTVTISVAASTTVTGAVVYPQSDLYNLKINDSEMDVCRSGFAFIGNSGGSLTIDNLLAFWVVRGVVRITSTGSWDVAITDSRFDGCGHPGNNTDTTWRNGIYISGAYRGSLTVDSTKFTKSSSFGGPISYLGDTITVRNSEFTDIDSANLPKFIQAGAYKIIIQNNYFTSSLLSSYTNARAITIGPSDVSRVKITGNTIVNTNASNFESYIQSDYILDVCDISSNNFAGPVTSAINPNIALRVNNIVNNTGLNPIQRYGAASPAIGLWAVGSIVWNTAPVASGAVGWICTAAGTPGTWKTFGVIAP